MDLHGTVLPDAPGPIAGLVLDRRVPPAVVVHHVGGAGEVEPRAPCLEREDERVGLAGLEAVDDLLAPGHPQGAVQEEGAQAPVLEVLLEEVPHRHVLGEHQGVVALVTDEREQVGRGVQLAGPARERPRLAQVVGRVVADLLERGQELQDQPPTGHPLGLGDGGHGLGHHRSVQRDLLGGERDEPVGLGLGRQVGDDVGVGLAPAQEERPHQAGEVLGGVGVAVAFHPHRHLTPEAVERAEQAGGGPVEERPEVDEAVLDRGAGECEAGPGRHRPQGPRRPRERVLHRLRLVGRHEPPPDRGQRLVVAAQHAVGDEDQGVGPEVVEGAVASVVSAHDDRGREAGRLPFPVGDEGHRADHEGRPPAVLGGLPAVLVARLVARFLEAEVQGEQLHGLAEAHVVRQHPAQAQPGHLGQPRQPPLLVGPQGGVEARGGCLDPLEACGHQAVGETGERALDLDRHRFAADVDRAAQSEVERGPAAERLPAPEALEQRRVGPQPLAPQADHRPLRLGQQRQLGLGEPLAVDRRLEPQLEQRVQ